MIIRGASGFGDAFYVYPIARHFKNHGEDVKVMTHFPEVFDDIDCIPFDRKPVVDIDCTYTRRKEIPHTTVWDDILIEAGMTLNFLSFGHPGLPERDPKYTLLIKPYQPGWCRDNDGFVPSYSFMASLAAEKGLPIKIIDYSLPLADWKKEYSKAGLIVTQSSSHFVMAEAWDVPCAVVFSEKSKYSNNWFVNTITPQKVIIKPATTQGFYDGVK